MSTHEQRGRGPIGNEEHTDLPATDRSFQNMSTEAFGVHLEDYPQYVRRIYKVFEEQRFVEIPRRLGQLRKDQRFCLRKQEVLDMDQWIRKRGPRMHIKEHQYTTDQIHKNKDKIIQHYTAKAFEDYQSKMRDGDEPSIGPTAAWSAMASLKKIQGIDDSRANLLLSVANPEAVPYCSGALSQWVLEKSAKQPLREQDYRDIFKEVEKKRHELTVAAIDIEKVAYVLECKAGPEKLRDTFITSRLVDGAPKVGSGRYGTVYKATIERPGCKGREVAIKAISLTGDMNQPSVLVETAISSELSKKYPEHFVDFLGWNDDRHCLYMAMEYVECGHLLEQQGWMQTDLRSATKQILEGLKFMHEQYIAHRDLKPTNVLVISGSPGVRVKIADFGVSKKLSARGTTNLRTYSGTRAYMAPEISEDEKNPEQYSYKVDIWSLGCIVYRMARGKDLFTKQPSKSIKSRALVLKNVEELKRGQRDKEKRKTRAVSRDEWGIQISKSGARFIRYLLQVKAEERPEAYEALGKLQEWAD